MEHFHFPIRAWLDNATIKGYTDLAKNSMTNCEKRRMSFPPFPKENIKESIVRELVANVKEVNYSRLSVREEMGTVDLSRGVRSPAPSRPCDREHYCSTARRPQISTLRTQRRFVYDIIYTRFLQARPG
jgi:hypothetical protein